MFRQQGHPTAGRGLPWWNDACRLAIAELTGLHGDERRQGYVTLRMTIWSAKRKYFEDLLEDPDVNIWDLAKWRNGRQQPKVPPICDREGLTTDPPRMAAAFRERFFPAVRFEDNVDTPPPALPFPAFPTRPFFCVTTAEVSAALQTCSLKSAPGPSGTSYVLVHWVHESLPTLLPLLFTAALRLGCNPWPNAKVVIIPKPGKADYSAPKAYRPISLMECLGKTLEKVVAT
jgi:hypothetical protein